MDTIEHSFLSGDFAVNVWKMFAGIFGITCRNLPFYLFIIKWWDAEYRNDTHRLLLHAVPIFVCWNLWKNKCGSKYAGKSSNLARVNYLVTRDTKLLLRTVFPYIH